MVRFFRHLAFSLLVLGLLHGTATPITADTYIWNSTGTDWAVASNWKTNISPTPTDSALFNPTGNSVGTTVNSPNLSGPVSILSLAIVPNQNLGGWTFSGVGSLSPSSGVSTSGPATYSFNNLAFANN